MKSCTRSTIDSKSALNRLKVTPGGRSTNHSRLCCHLVGNLCILSSMCKVTTTLHNSGIWQGKLKVAQAKRVVGVEKSKGLLTCIRHYRKQLTTSKYEPTLKHGQINNRRKSIRIFSSWREHINKLGRRRIPKQILQYTGLQIYWASGKDGSRPYQTK